MHECNLKNFSVQGRSEVIYFLNSFSLVQNSQQIQNLGFVFNSNISDFKRQSPPLKALQINKTHMQGSLQTKKRVNLHNSKSKRVIKSKTKIFVVKCVSIVGTYNPIGILQEYDLRCLGNIVKI